MLPWMHYLRIVPFPNNSLKRNFCLRKVPGKVLSATEGPCLRATLSYLCLPQKFLKPAGDMRDRINLFGGPVARICFSAPPVFPTYCPLSNVIVLIASTFTLTPVQRFLVLWSTLYYFLLIWLASTLLGMCIMWAQCKLKTSLCWMWGTLCSTSTFEVVFVLFPSAVVYN